VYNKKSLLYTYAAICIISLLLLFGLPQWLGPSWFLERYATQLSERLIQWQEEAQYLLERKEALVRLAEGSTHPDSTQASDFAFFNQLAQLPFNIFVYRKDSLLLWGRLQAALPDSILQQVASWGTPYRLVHLSNGWYLLHKWRLDEAQSLDLYVLMPVRYEFPLQSAYLRNEFPAFPAIPPQVQVRAHPSGQAVVQADGVPVFWLYAEQPFKDRHFYQLLFFLMVASGIAAMLLINGIAVHLVNTYKPFVGALFLMAAIGLLRAAMLMYDWAARFEGVGGMAEVMRTRIFESTLGDLLLNVGLLLWMMVFFHREFEVMRQPVRYKGAAVGLSMFNQAAVVAGIVAIVDVIQNLVLDSDIDFSLQNFLEIRLEGVLAIAAIMLMLFSLFLFSHRMMLTVLHIGLTKKERLLSMIGAVVIAFGIMSLFEHFHSIMVPVEVLMVLCVIYMTLFDFFLDDESPGLSWLLGWLIAMSAFTAGLLYFFNSQKDLRRQLNYAKQLSTFSDPLLEKHIVSLDEDLKAKLKLFERDSPAIEEVSNYIEAWISKYFLANKYLLNNYTYEFFSYHLRDTLPISAAASAMGRGVFLRLQYALDAVRLEHRHESVDERDLYFWSDGNSHFAYLWVEAWPGYGAAEQSDGLLTVVEIQRRKDKPSMVYSELLLQHPYKNMDLLNQYSWAVYQHGKLVDSGGERDFSTWLMLPPPPAGGHRLVEPGDGLCYVIYQSEEDITVVIGRKEESIKVFVSLFSYLFTLWVVITIILAMLNSTFHFLPPAIALELPSLPPLRNRIQYSVIGLFLASFFMIGFTTFSYFKESTNAYHENRLERKMTAAKTHAEHEIAILNRLEGEIDLHALTVPLSRVHRLDVNLYDTRGRLISSSEEDIYQRGIVPPLINGHAWYALAMQGYKLAILDETIGKLKYKVAYVALRDPQERIVAYMGLPYYAHLREKNSEVASFMGALLNVYVLILIIASAMAVLVANSITKPLTDLGEGLRRLRLDGRNEPLRWSSRDELGELISEYNRMLFKLDEAKKELAQREREGAWREMAKQVAHEIKNPLTPMKLSIQYLLRAYEMNQDQIGPMFKRVAQTIIEQIEELTRIASEFSNFAKLPQPQPELFELNELVSSVYQLFSNEREDVQLSLALADEPLYVYVDKAHLMRVLNNLVKNAIQAIPPDRIGQVHISVRRSEFDPSRVAIRVRDNGRGIPEELQSKVFVPNFTTKSSGSGLGLAICRNLVQAMGGHISFNSIPERSTEFVVELPLAERPVPSQVDDSHAGKEP